MSKRKKGISDESMEELEYTCPSATEMTGLIPREANDSEIDSYESICPFLPGRNKEGHC